MIATKHAMTSIGMEMEQVMQWNDNKIDCSEVTTELDDISVAFSGKYSLVITNNILEAMKRI
jgi:hypothetical protein